jgi:hypothetical protein
MTQLEIEFFHNAKNLGEKDQLDKCIELYPEIDSMLMWMPMRVFIGDKIEEYLKKNIHIDN